MAPPRLATWIAAALLAAATPLAAQEPAVDARLEELREALTAAAGAAPGDAAEALERARSLADDPAWVEDHPARVEALYRWAGARVNVNVGEAGDGCSRALAMAARLGLDDASVRGAQLLRGLVRERIGDREGAREDVIAALERHAALDAPSGEDLEALWQVAIALGRLGVYDLALGAWELGLGRATDLHGPDHFAPGSWLAEWVDLHVRLNDPQGAIAAIEREREGLTLSDDDRIRLDNAHVIALDRVGRRSEALEIAGRAVEESARLFGPTSGRAAILLDTYGVLLSKEGRLEEAVAIRERLAGLEGLSNLITASNLENHAYLLAKLGRHDAAREGFWAAVDRTRAAFGYGASEVSRVLTQVAIFELHHGNVADADVWLRLAQESFELSRLQVDDAYTRARYHEAAPHAFRALLSLRRGDPRAAWLASERSAGSVTLEMLSGSIDADRRRLWSKHLRNQHRERFRAWMAPKLGKRARDPERLRKHEDALRHLLDDWTSTNPWLGGARSPEHVQALLAPDQAIVGWLVHHNKDLDPEAQNAWILRREGPPEFVNLGAVGDLFNPHLRAGRALVEAATSVFGGGDAHEADAEILARHLLHPLLPKLDGVRHLVVCPSDVLLHVPVECLPDPDGAPLLERFDVSYAPSAAVWAFLTERPRRGELAGRALLLGDPPYQRAHLEAMRREEDDASLRPRTRSGSAREASLDALPRLPASRREVEAVAALFEEPTLLVGADASEDALADFVSSGELARFGTLHLASHARVDQVRPTESLLALDRVSSREAHDGLVTVAEILGSWELGADLVVLSACETASGRRTSREGLFGFAQALFASGARSVVASKWEVDDRATELLMLRFHELLAGRHGAPRSKVRALAEAKRWLREYEDGRGGRPYAHPSTWAAFVLTGASD